MRREYLKILRARDRKALPSSLSPNIDRKMDLMSTRDRLAPGNEFLCVNSRSGKGIPVAAALLLLIAFFARARKSFVASFPVWVVSSLMRVGKTDAPEALASIELSGARGETVDSQVVVQSPARGLTNVNLSVSALTGPNGVSIPPANVTLYREHYLTVIGTANYGGGSNPPLVLERIQNHSSRSRIRKPGLPCAQVRHFKGCTLAWARRKISPIGSTFPFHAAVRTPRPEPIWKHLGHRGPGHGSTFLDADRVELRASQAAVRTSLWTLCRLRSATTRRRWREHLCAIRLWRGTRRREYLSDRTKFR